MVDRREGSKGKEGGGAHLGNMACPMMLENPTSHTCCITQNTSHRILMAVSLL